MLRRHSSIIKVILFLLAVGVMAQSADAGNVRVRNAARIQGVRENQLLGYGLVVGLQSTGDRPTSIYSTGNVTVQTVVNMLQKFGVVVAPGQIKPNNVAAVMVSATLPPFVKSGDKIDVTASSVGDARSLQGGTLLETPLLGADGNVYAVAQGSVSVGGAETQPGFIFQKLPVNAGRIPEGALVEKEVPTSIVERGTYLNIILNRPDFTSATNLTDVINKQFWGPIASAKDAATIKIEIPLDYQKNIVEFIAALEGLDFDEEEVSNKVVINERTGTIVMGFDVRIDTVAISHGNLSVYISPAQAIVNGGIPGETVKVPKGDEGKGNLLVIPGEAVSLSEVVGVLNSIGATPKEMIAIIQAIKDAGALHATLEIM